MLTKFLTLVRNPLESTVTFKLIMKTFKTWISRVFPIPGHYVPLYIISDGIVGQASIIIIACKASYCLVTLQNKLKHLDTAQA